MSHSGAAWGSTASLRLTLVVSALASHVGHGRRYQPEPANHEGTGAGVEKLGKQTFYHSLWMTALRPGCQGSRKTRVHAEATAVFARPGAWLTRLRRPQRTEANCMSTICLGRPTPSVDCVRTSEDEHTRVPEVCRLHSNVSAHALAIHAPGTHPCAPHSATGGATAAGARRHTEPRRGVAVPSTSTFVSGIAVKVRQMHLVGARCANSSFEAVG